MPDQWYVCRVKAPALAVCGLRQQSFEVYAPTVDVECLRHHKLSVQKRPLFGPYVLVEFDLAADFWQKINTTMGVVRLLPLHCEEPLPLPGGYVDSLKALERSREFVSRAYDVTRGYAVGDYVEVKRGHGAGYGGKLLAFHRKQMVVLLSCMTGYVRAKIPPECVDVKPALELGAECRS